MRPGVWDATPFGNADASHRRAQTTSRFKLRVVMQGGRGRVVGTAKAAPRG